MAAAPLAFVPVLQERVWGGRRLVGDGDPRAAVGESWLIVDRPEAQSVVAHGPRAGATLGELWAGEREDLFGTRAREAGPRFPLLVKLLDARETLSVQVHPPAGLAEELGGEPKTELWYLADAEPGAFVLAGLRAGVTRERLAAALEAREDVSALLHRIDVAPGDALMLPSGRVHALGAGCLVLEVQQSSDTTYRVYDFDRPGLDGHPRELHVPQSLASIDFDDVEPALQPAGGGLLADCESFTVSRHVLGDRAEPLAAPGECAVVSVLEGEAVCADERFGPHSTFLVPAADDLLVAGRAVVLVTQLP